MKNFNERLRNSKEYLSRCGNETFSTKCYDILQKVPIGRVTTYGEIAKALGSKGYRAVGNAMNKNPYAPKVPCHRVVASDGRLNGYAEGLEKKAEILKSEGVEVVNMKVVDFKDKMFRFYSKCDK